MFKKFGLFFCLAVLMATYSVNAGAFESIPELIAMAELEQTMMLPQEETPEIKIESVAKTIDTVFELEEIPYDTIIIETEELPIGEQIVYKEGSLGETLVIKRTTYIGENTLEESTSERIMIEPISEIVHLGIGENLIKTEDGYLKYTKKLEVSATAYCLCKKCTGKVPGQKGYGITASGLPAAYGVVAVDPKVIPLGTKLYIEDYGVSIAGDTGSGVNGYTVDLFYDDTAFTEKFGRQPRTVYILAD